MDYCFPCNGRNRVGEGCIEQRIAGDHGRNYTEFDGGVFIDQGGFHLISNRLGMGNSSPLHSPQY